MGRASIEEAEAGVGGPAAGRLLRRNADRPPVAGGMERFRIAFGRRDNIP